MSKNHSTNGDYVLPPLTNLTAIERHEYTNVVMNYVQSYNPSNLGAVPFWEAVESHFGRDCAEFYLAMSLSDIANFIDDIEEIGKGDKRCFEAKNERLRDTLSAYEVASIFLQSYHNAVNDTPDIKYKGYQMASVWLHKKLTTTEQIRLLTIVSLERNDSFLDVFRDGHSANFDAFTKTYFNGETMAEKNQNSGLAEIEAELAQQKRITELEAKILAERRMREIHKKAILGDE